MKRIAIIGAGISGLALARRLSTVAEVTVFEKARGVGGRMSTRYADPFYFDHGAQCFTARSAEFQAFLKPYMEAGSVAEWKGDVVNLEVGKAESKRIWLEPHLVATPNMNSLCKALAVGLDLRTACEVAPLGERDAMGWELQDKEGKALGMFDWVISTAPPAQTVRLFGEYLEEGEPIRTAGMQGCYALMLGFARPWHKPWIAAKVRDNPIKWISVNSSKPGRNSQTTSLVVHSRNDWAEEHIDDDMEGAQAFLLGQFERVTGFDGRQADYISLHRWRYAIVDTTQKPGTLFNAALGLAATSDWCETSRIEEAWQHADRLADSILQSME